MMKTYYRLDKNGITIAENEDLLRIKEIAQSGSSVTLDWQDNTDEDGFYHFSFGSQNRIKGRDEFEITVFRKRF